MGQEVLPSTLLIVGAGVRPRQELAESCGLELGGRGGIKAWGLGVGGLLRLLGLELDGWGWGQGCWDGASEVLVASQIGWPLVLKIACPAVCCERQVDHRMKTATDEHIWAVGEIASYNGGMCYQLSAPGALNQLFKLDGIARG